MTVHCWPVPLQETLKFSKAGLVQSLVGSLGPDVHKVLFEPSERIWQVWGLILNMISPLVPSSWGSPLFLDVVYAPVPTILLGFSFALGHGVFPQSHCTVLEQNWEEIENMKDQTGTEIENVV